MRRTILIIALMLALDGAQARDTGQWSDRPADIRQWFNGLTNAQGGQCCSFADGISIEDPDWRITAAGTYQVFYHQQWRDVPTQAIVVGRNHIGHAVVWPIEYPSPGIGVPGTIVIRCFLKGQES
jgi:hypothetical protein